MFEPGLIKHESHEYPQLACEIVQADNLLTLSHLKAAIPVTWPDADKLLARLHALSGMAQPLNYLAQISRLYEALDRIAVRCAPAQLNPITEAFSQKAIILTEAGEWMTSGEVSIFPDEDNNSPTVHASLRNFSLWPRIGVSERPALERTIEWLKSLESGAKLDATAAKRVRSPVIAGHAHLLVAKRKH